MSATSGWMPRVRRHGLAIAFAASGWGLAMALVGFAPDVWVALGCLAVAGGGDECSAVFRDTMWKQSIPDHLRGRMAGIEPLSYAAGPPAGQLRSGAVAAVTSVRFSLASGGLACVAAVAAVVVMLPAFRRYTGPTGDGDRPGAGAGRGVRFGSAESGGTSRAGLRSKKPNGLSQNETASAGITGQSSGRVMWWMPNTYQSTTSVFSMFRSAAVQAGGGRTGCRARCRGTTCRTSRSAGPRTARVPARRRTPTCRRAPGSGR